MKRMLAGGLFCFALATVGCKQGLRDRCQVDDDCEDGLLCFYANSTDTAIGGQCLASPPSVDAGVIDAAVDRPIDGPVDASED
jgi:hypothetical protein